MFTNERVVLVSCAVLSKVGRPSSGDVVIHDGRIVPAVAKDAQLGSHLGDVFTVQM